MSGVDELEAARACRHGRSPLGAAPVASADAQGRGDACAACPTVASSSLIAHFEPRWAVESHTVVKFSNDSSLGIGQLEQWGKKLEDFWDILFDIPDILGYLFICPQDFVSMGPKETPRRGWRRPRRAVTL